MARISKAKQIAQLTEDLAIQYTMVIRSLIEVANSPGINKEALDKWERTDERLRKTQQKLRDLGIPVELVAD